MKNKKITYNSKTRQDVSNPFNGMTHEQLLKNAKVQIFNGHYTINKLDNGRIVVKGKK